MKLDEILLIEAKKKAKGKRKKKALPAGGKFIDYPRRGWVGGWGWGHGHNHNDSQGESSGGGDGGGGE